MNQVRYDPVKRIYRDCKWCNGRGCLGCEEEADKAYKRQFPNGPVPIATFTREQVEAGALRNLLGPAAIESAEQEAARRAETMLSEANINISGVDPDELKASIARGLVKDVLTERIVATGTKEQAANYHGE